MTDIELKAILKQKILSGETTLDEAKAEFNAFKQSQEPQLSLGGEETPVVVDEETPRLDIGVIQPPLQEGDAPLTEPQGQEIVPPEEQVVAPPQEQPEMVGDFEAQTNAKKDVRVLQLMKEGKVDEAKNLYYKILEEKQLTSGGGLQNAQGGAPVPTPTNTIWSNLWEALSGSYRKKTIPEGTREVSEMYYPSGMERIAGGLGTPKTPEQAKNLAAMQRMQNIGATKGLTGTEDLLLFTQTMDADSKQRAEIMTSGLNQMAEESGMNDRAKFEYRDGNYYIYSPFEKEEFVIPPGMNLQDLRKFIGSMTADQALGGIFNWAGKIKKLGGFGRILQKIGKGQDFKYEALNQALRQGAFEGVKGASGATPDVTNIGFAGAVGGVGRLGGQLIEGTANTAKLSSAFNKADKGDLTDLKQLAKDDPEKYNAYADFFDLVDYSPGEPLRIKADTEKVLRKVARKRGLNEDEMVEHYASQVKRVLEFDPTVRDAAMRQGWYNFMSPRELADDVNADTKIFLDALRSQKPEVGSGLSDKLQKGIVDITNDVEDKITKLGKSSDINSFARNLEDTMNLIEGRHSKMSDKYYNELSSYVPKDAQVKSSTAFGYLDKKVKGTSDKPVKKGYVAKSGDEPVSGYDKMTQLQKDAYNLLRPKGRVSPAKTTTGKTQIKPAQKYYDNAKYEDVVSLRNRVNEAIKKGENVVENIELAKFIKDDIDTYLSSIPNLPQDAKNIWKAARNHYSAKLAAKENLYKVFGQAADKDFVQKTVGAISDLSGGGYKKFETMINAAPKHMRREYVARAVFHSIKKNSKDMNFQAFGDWWNNLKTNNKEAMKFFKNPKYMNKETYQLMEDLGEVSKNIGRSRRGVSDMTPAQVSDKIRKNQSYVGSVFNAGLTGIAAGALASSFSEATAWMTGGATGSVALGLQILSAVRGGKSNKELNRLVKFINSKPTKEFLNSGKTMKDIRKLSLSQDALRWAKQVGIANNRSELEKWIIQSTKKGYTASELNDKYPEE